MIMDHQDSYIALKNKSWDCPRGLILELRENGRYYKHFHGHPHQPLSREELETVCKDSFEPYNISCSEDEVAPLTEKECCLLSSLSEDETSYEVYSSERGLLEWGVGLSVGHTVLAQLPEKKEKKVVVVDSDQSRVGPQYVTAVIRWCGVERHCQKYMFGVEILDKNSRGHGDSSGEYQVKDKSTKYFSCEENCGMFLTFDGLDKPSFVTNGLSSSSQDNLPLSNGHSLEEKSSISNKQSSIFNGHSSNELEELPPIISKAHQQHPAVLLNGHTLC